MPRKVTEIQTEIEQLEKYLKTAKPHEVTMLNNKRAALYKELSGAQAVEQIDFNDLFGQGNTDFKTLFKNIFKKHE